MKEKRKTWLDGLIGWAEEGNVIETFWAGDPAVDQDKSDIEAYLDNLDTSHLALKPGCKPVAMQITLPDAPRWGNISAHLHEAGQATAAIVAFQICVRFPEVEDARPTIMLGFQRLNQRFMMALTREFPDMVNTVGYWIIRKYLLLEEEKKASSPGSTESSSSSAGFTTAPSATNEGSGSKDAPTSVRGQSRRRKRASSG